MTQTGVKNSLQLRLVEKKCSLESGLGGQAASGLDKKKVALEVYFVEKK